jgi:hypothetical protein
MPVVPITSVQMKELLASESETVRVYAEKEWNHTQMQLVKGGIYRFAVTPPDQEWRYGNILPPFDAEGRNIGHLMAAVPFLRMPSAKWFALVGCIGKKRRTFFKIGKLLDLFVAPGTGELVCFANDVWQFHRDNNQGYIDLTVTRLR